MEGNRYPRYVSGAGYTASKRKWKDIQDFAAASDALVPPLELKWVDHEVPNFTNIQINDTVLNVNANIDPPTTNCINGVAQGQGPQRRKGRQILMKSLHIKGVVRWESDSGSSLSHATDRAYVAVVLDTMTNDALMTSFDCFEKCPAHLSSSPFRRLETGNRYRILKSWHLDNLPKLSTAKSIEGVPLVENAETRKYFEGFIPLNMPCNFDGDTDICLEIDDNSLHVVAYHDTNVEVAQLSYKTRLRFMDG